MRPSGPVACPRRAACSRVRDCVARPLIFKFNPFFNFSLVDELRRTLRRVTIHFKFIFINVLCHALRRATIHFKFILINELCRALRCATFRLKFSSVDVRRRALHRATPNVSL
jgi:hypothetical protein